MENELLPLLDDEEYANFITESSPIWLAEGHKELLDYRSIWDWNAFHLGHNLCTQ